jgi:hypothetical protein
MRLRRARRLRQGSGRPLATVPKLDFVVVPHREGPFATRLALGYGERHSRPRGETFPGLAVVLVAQTASGARADEGR